MVRLWLLAALLIPSPCLAQITGTFSLEKSTFAPGEPVVLSFTLHNAGKEEEEITAADPYSFCSGYKIHISRDAVSEPVCSQGYGGSCLSGAILLAPDATRTERILLNYRNNSKGDSGTAVSAPGGYTVDASREIDYATVGSGNRIYTAPDHGEAHQVFHLRVDDALEVSPAVYAPYIQQLDSKTDDQIRREAARTLATLAPRSLEPLLISFASSKDYAIKQFAPLALANLSTKASVVALAEMLLHSEPGTYEYMMAADKLGKTHDPAWLPLLLEVVDQHGAMYLPYAAEAGGEAAIPQLVARLHTSDFSVRAQAVYALGHTGSRAAVPLLISLLSSQAGQDGRNLAISAGAALTTLTHVYAEQDQEGDSIASWHSRWQQWWLASGSTAAIYKPGECGSNVLLP